MAAARTARGFTLIELLVTVAIVAIVAAIATASYRQYIIRANRSDATVALLRLAAAQEKFYLQHGEYAGSELLAEPPPLGLGIIGTEHGFYDLEVRLPEGGAALGFSAIATVDPDAAQADDEGCWILGIDAQGLRTAETRDGLTGTTVTERCWR